MKLAADEMLGRLSVWLRILGLDTVLLGPGLTRVEKRLRVNNRVFLTRERDLVIGRTLHLESDDPFAQLREVIDRLDLAPTRWAPLSRCLRCNTALKKISRQEAAGLVPDYIWATQPAFQRCPDCRRIYWPGSHHQRMRAKLDALAREMGSPRGS